MDVLVVAAVVVLGVMVGVEFAVAVFVNPIFDRLPGTAGLAARTDGARVLGRVMPFWYVGALALVLGWMVLAWGSGAVVPLAVGAGLLVLTVVLSLLFLVPINDRARTWSEGDAPADWRAQLARWDRLHHLRTALLVAAFAAVAVGLLLL